MDEYGIPRVRLCVMWIARFRSFALAVAALPYGFVGTRLCRLQNVCREWHDLRQTGPSMQLQGCSLWCCVWADSTRVFVLVNVLTFTPCHYLRTFSSDLSKSHRSLFWSWLEGSGLLAPLASYAPAYSSLLLPASCRIVDGKHVKVKD